jgi:hypothetical protein
MFRSIVLPPSSRWSNCFFSGKPKVLHRVQESIPLDTNLSQFNLVHTFIPQSLRLFHDDFPTAMVIKNRTEHCRSCFLPRPTGPLENRVTYLLTYLLTHSMCRILFEKLVVTQLVKKYHAFLWNPKVHYRAHTSSPMDPILSQLNPVRPIDPYLAKVRLNVILTPTPRSSQWSLTFGLPNQNPVNTSPLPDACLMSRPPHPPWFNHPNDIRWRIWDMKFITVQFSPQSVLLPFRSKHPHFTSYTC